MPNMDDELSTSINQIGGFGVLISKTFSEMKGQLGDLRGMNTHIEDDLTDLKVRLKAVQKTVDKVQHQIKNQMSFGGGGEVRASSSAGSGGAGDQDSMLEMDPLEEVSVSGASDHESATGMDLEGRAQSQTASSSSSSDPAASDTNDDVEKATSEESAEKQSMWSKKKIKSKAATLKAGKGWLALTRDLSKLRSLSKERLNKSVTDVSRNLRNAVYEATEDSDQSSSVDEKIGALRSLCENIATGVNDSLSHVQLVNETTLHQIGALEKFLDQQKTDIEDLSHTMHDVVETQKNHEDMLHSINNKLEYLFFGKVEKMEDRDRIEAFLQSAGIEDSVDHRVEMKTAASKNGVIGRLHLLERTTDGVLDPKLDQAVLDIKNLTQQQGDMKEIVDSVGEEFKTTLKNEFKVFEEQLTQQSPFFELLEKVRLSWSAAAGDMKFALGYAIKLLAHRGINLSVGIEFPELIIKDPIPLTDMLDLYPQHRLVYEFLTELLNMHDMVHQMVAVCVPHETEHETMSAIHARLDQLVRDTERFVAVRGHTLNDNGAVYVQDAKVATGGEIEEELMLDLSHVQGEDRAFNIARRLLESSEVSMRLLDSGVPVMKLQRRVEDLETHERIIQAETALLAHLEEIRTRLDAKVLDEVLYADINKKANKAELIELRDALFRQMEKVRDNAAVANMTIAATGGMATSGAIGESGGGPETHPVHGKLSDMQERFDLLYRHFQDLQKSTDGHIGRSEVEEAMNALVGEVKLLKASTVDRGTFEDTLRLKASRAEVQSLVDGLQVTVGDLRERSTEVGLFEATTHSIPGAQEQVHQQQQLQAEQKEMAEEGKDGPSQERELQERRRTSNNIEATRPSMHMELYRPSSAAIIAARCLVCDKLVEDQVRPLTQPSRRQIASAGRAKSPGNRGRVPSTSLPLHAMNSEYSQDVHVMSNSLELPPLVTDTSRAMSLGSQHTKKGPQGADKVIEKGKARLRSSGGAGMYNQKQNTR